MSGKGETMHGTGAREALQSVAAMEQAAARRVAWPWWLSVCVALAVSAPGVFLMTGWFDAVPRMAVGIALFLLAFAATVLVQRYRGVRLERVLTVRIATAVAIQGLAVLGTVWVRDEARLDGPGPLIFGALVTTAILMAFAIIGLIERQRAEAGR